MTRYDKPTFGYIKDDGYQLNLPHGIKKEQSNEKNSKNKNRDAEKKWSVLEVRGLVEPVLGPEGIFWWERFVKR